MVSLQESELKLAEKKRQLENFQPEFCDIKKKYEEACKKLEEDITETIGKKHASKKYDQFALNTSCFWGITGSNITPIVYFHKNFATKMVMNKFSYSLLLLLK